MHWQVANNRPRVLMAALVTAALLTAGAVLALRGGGGNEPIGLLANGSTRAAAQTVKCPNVANRVKNVPARAQAEVDRNLALLRTQIREANARLAQLAVRPEGGPNFVRNAILGPLASKRTATIDRIEIAIGRVAARPNLSGLDTCTLNAAGGTTAGGAGGNAGNAGGNAGSSGDGNGTNAGAQTVNCPNVRAALPAVPAQARAEVDRNLATLQTQINEANARLARLAANPEGGPNFIQNAILGPLEDKRTAAIDRIAISIGRVAARPNLSGLATCTLNAAGANTGGNAGGNAGANTGGNAGANTGGNAAQTVNCPNVRAALPAVPAQARAEVDRNLATLQTQINEANARLARLAANPEGGPNFIQNAILGPLEDKRTAAIDRIAISIGRVAARPNLSGLAACSLA